MSALPTAGVNSVANELLAGMIRGRALEAAVKTVSGFYHAALGEEAVIVGAFKALAADDVGLPHYRGAIVASLMRGATSRELLAGIVGKVTGPTRGRQRGDFVGKFSDTHFGLFSGTLGPSIGYATGSALAATLDGSNVATLVTFGDGTSNSGLLYESLNIASMLKLPVVFLCQNNQFAISMPAEKAIAGGALTKRAEAFGIAATLVDGNDAMAVYEACRTALAAARQGAGPHFIEARTYRAGGHWVSDPSAYRENLTPEILSAQDPITRLAEAMIAGGSLDEMALAEIRKQADAEISEAMALVQDDPWPEAGDVIATANAYAV